MVIEYKFNKNSKELKLNKNKVKFKNKLNNIDKK
jgi:hypothetical protein